MFAFDPVGWLGSHRPWHNIQLPFPSLAIREQSLGTVLAMCCWGEARADGALGMLLIGCVVRNRVHHAPRYGQGWLGVLLRPRQFRCFDPEYDEFEKVRTPLRYGGHELWEQACCAAYDVLEDRCSDLTDGATHYAPLGEQPWWVGPVIAPTVRYRDRLFYREEALAA